MEAAGERRLDGRLGGTIRSADQLDEDVAVRLARHADRIVEPGERRDVEAAVLRPVAGGDGGDAGGAAGTGRKGVALRRKRPGGGRADGSQSGDGEAEG